MANIPEHPNGLYMLSKETGPVIILGKHLNRSKRLHRCVLAEEIGHHFTAPRTNIVSAYTSINQKTMLSQDERKAMKWASDFLIPDGDFVTALKAGHRSRFDLAEYFDVTEQFMVQKIGMMQTCFKVDQQMFHLEIFE